MQNCISSETHNWYMYTIWEIETPNLWLTQMPSQGAMAGRKIFVCLSTYMLFVEQPWSVSRYVMGQSGNDQQCLAAPIWKYRSGFGDHRFTFFIDLRPNHTFYTNLTNIVHWIVACRDVAHLVRLNLGKSWEKSAKSFDAGLTVVEPTSCDCVTVWLSRGQTYHWLQLMKSSWKWNYKDSGHNWGGLKLVH